MNPSPLTPQRRRSNEEIFTSRVLFAASMVVIALLVLILRLTQLQVIEHQQYITKSQENRVKLMPLPPTRGLIYDTNGVLLAQNLPAYTLELIPEKVDDLDQTIAALQELLPITEDDRKRFNHQRQRRRRFDRSELRRQLNEQEVATFAVRQHQFPGVHIRASLLRDYPLGTDTAHVLGYVGRISERDLQRIEVSNYRGTDYIGKNGLEKSYESTLHGTVGHQQVEVNAEGRILRVLENDPPIPGRDLHLFLDIRLQQTAFEALADYKGAAVAIDPQTGGILALVSKPSFEPNLFVDGISHTDYNALNQSPDRPLFNRALRGNYPPGSTVKPFIGLAGLETDTISVKKGTYCPGFYQLPGHSHKYRDWRRGGHGTVRLNSAIVQSCDVYFYDLARLLGIDRLHDFLDQFGFGRPTEVDLTGEVSGLLPSREWKRQVKRKPWYPGETLITGIGQGYFGATPLQLASATATLAMHGLHIRPRLVKATWMPGESQPEPIEPHQVQLPVKRKRDWDAVIQAMIDVIEHPRGTAKRIRSKAYRIGGKTGTAQVFTVKQDEKYDEKRISHKLRDHALFIAFAPVESPQIAVAVIVENGGHGGAVAAPIAKQIMDRYLLDFGHLQAKKEQTAQDERR